MYLNGDFCFLSLWVAPSAAAQLSPAAVDAVESSETPVPSVGAG